MQMEKVGYIGLGIMGKAMVENLAKAGHKVNVFARRQASVDALETDNYEAFAHASLTGRSLQYHHFMRFRHA